MLSCTTLSLTDAYYITGMGANSFMSPRPGQRLPAV
jgi:hypothetical protein